MNKISFLIIWMIVIMLMLSITFVFAQEVYIPRKSVGYANYDDNVVIIRMNETITPRQYLWVAMHEYAHFQHEYASRQEQRQIKQWYRDLDNYTTTYSQTCTRCTPYEEEYAEWFASTWVCYQRLPVQSIYD